MNDDLVICTWPNGEQREVAVMERLDGKARIIWNEKVNTDLACIIGFDDCVPLSWLADVDPDKL